MGVASEWKQWTYAVGVGSGCCMWEWFGLYLVYLATHRGSGCHLGMRVGVGAEWV